MAGRNQHYIQRNFQRKWAIETNKDVDKEYIYCYRFCKEGNFKTNLKNNFSQKDFYSGTSDTYRDDKITYEYECRANNILNSLFYNYNVDIKDIIWFIRFSIFRTNSLRKNLFEHINEIAREEIKSLEDLKEAGLDSFFEIIFYKIGIPFLLKIGIKIEKKPSKEEMDIFFENIAEDFINTLKSKNLQELILEKTKPLLPANEKISLVLIEQVFHWLFFENQKVLEDDYFDNHYFKICDSNQDIILSDNIAVFIDDNNDFYSMYHKSYNIVKICMPISPNKVLVLANHKNLLNIPEDLNEMLASVSYKSFSSNVNTYNHLKPLIFKNHSITNKKTLSYKLKEETDEDSLEEFFQSLNITLLSFIDKKN